MTRRKYCRWDVQWLGLQQCICRILCPIASHNQIRISFCRHFPISALFGFLTLHCKHSCFSRYESPIVGLFVIYTVEECRIYWLILLIVMVSNGSFQVHAKEVNKFQLAYAAVLKSNMDNLKKRERKAPGAAIAKRKSETRKAKKAQ